MCTRVVYPGPEGRVLTARSMDWATDTGTNLWIFPRGIERHGVAGPNSIEWTSKYGSVIAGAFDICTCDGINEAGLVANVLWLVESVYPSTEDNRPGLSIAAWVQYVLDNFATVAEAVAGHSPEPFTVVTAQVPGQDRLATMHLSVSDPSGDSAIFEYVDGKLEIHHNPEYQVMTNSPVFSEQLALNSYWEGIGGTVMLPGTNRAADRFVRASFYIRAIPRVDDRRLATAGVFSVIRSVSVPYGISTPDQPNISSTQWCTVADHKDRIYYYDSALSPGIFWVELDRIDVSESAPTRKLDVASMQAAGRSGDVSSEFVATPPFQFAGLDSRG